MLASGNESMNGNRILQLSQSGCQGCLHIGGFPQNQVLPQMQSQLSKKNVFRSSLKIQALFSFIGVSGLLIRVVLHQSGFKRAKDSWVLGLVGSWLLMQS